MKRLMRFIVLVLFVFIANGNVSAQSRNEGNFSDMTNGLPLPKKEGEAPVTEKKDTLMEVEHGVRIGLDLLSLASPFLSGKGNSGWMVMSDFRIKPKTYLALDFGQSQRTFDFSQQMLNVDGWFVRAGANFTLMRGIISQDDMIFAGAKLGYSNFNRHIYGANIDNGYWGESSSVDIKDKASAAWVDLSIGVMVRLFSQVYLSMQGGYDMVLTSSKPNGIKPMAVPGIGQVYNSGTGFSFSYTLSYRIPLYKKTHKTKVKVEVSTQEQTDRQRAENDKKKKDFKPAFDASKVIEE